MTRLPTALFRSYFRHCGPISYLLYNTFEIRPDYVKKRYAIHGNERFSRGWKAHDSLEEPNNFQSRVKERNERSFVTSLCYVAQARNDYLCVLIIHSELRHDYQPRSIVNSRGYYLRKKEGEKKSGTRSISAASARTETHASRFSSSLVRRRTFEESRIGEPGGIPRWHNSLKRIRSRSPRRFRRISREQRYENFRATNFGRTLIVVVLTILPSPMFSSLVENFYLLDVRNDPSPPSVFISDRFFCKRKHTINRSF